MSIVLHFSWIVCHCIRLFAFINRRTRNNSTSILSHMWPFQRSDTERSPSSLPAHLPFTPFLRFSLIVFTLHSIFFGPETTLASLVTFHLLYPSSSFVFHVLCLLFIFLTKRIQSSCLQATSGLQEYFILWTDCLRNTFSSQSMCKN